MTHRHDSKANSWITVDPDRLLNAADVLIEAWNKPSRGNAMIDVWMDDPASAPPDRFTCLEFVEATRLLVRLGVLTPSDPRWRNLNLSTEP